MAKNRTNTTDANKLILLSGLWLLLAPAILLFYLSKVQTGGVPFVSIPFLIYLVVTLSGGILAILIGCFDKLSKVNAFMRVFLSFVVALLYFSAGYYYTFIISLLAWRLNIL